MDFQGTDFLKNELKKEQELLDIYKERKLNLDMSRGKPSTAQLDISSSLLDELTSTSNFGKIDYRN
jgi:hypothetical protein